MRIISLSLDRKVLDPQSAVAQRLVSFDKNLDRYFVIVPASKKQIELSSKVTSLGISGSNKIDSLFNIYKELNKLLKKEKFDLLTVQDSSYLAFLGLRIAKKFGLKFEVQIHGFEKNSFFRDFFTKYTLSKADLVRVVSQRLKSYLIKKYNLSTDKIYIAPVVLNISKLSNTGTIDLHKIYPGDFIFLTIGRLVPIKNISLQIRAIKKLSAREKTKLIIVGDGPEKDKLKKLANDLNVREQVIFYGWQDKIGDLYHSADCFLLTSDSEGYGLVAVEATNCNLPIVMTDVGCAQEIIKDNVQGIIIPVGDEQALVKAMEKMRQVEYYQNIKNKLSQQTKINNQDTFEVIIKKWQAQIKKY